MRNVRPLRSAHQHPFPELSFALDLVLQEPDFFEFVKLEQVVLIFRLETWVDEVRIADQSADN